MPPPGVGWVGAAPPQGARWLLRGLVAACAVARSGRLQPIVGELPLRERRRPRHTCSSRRSAAGSTTPAAEGEKPPEKTPRPSRLERTRARAREAVKFPGLWPPQGIRRCELWLGRIMTPVRESRLAMNHTVPARRVADKQTFPRRRGGHSELAHRPWWPFSPDGSCRRCAAENPHADAAANGSWRRGTTCSRAP